MNFQKTAPKILCAYHSFGKKLLYKHSDGRRWAPAQDFAVTRASLEAFLEHNHDDFSYKCDEISWTVLNKGYQK